MTKGDTDKEHQSIQEKGALAAVQGIKLGKTRIMKHMGGWQGVVCVCVHEYNDIFFIDINKYLLDNGQIIRAPNIVITTGTFLGGEIHLGLKVWPAGRMGENPSIGLSNSLRQAGFKLARLKTGALRMIH